MQGFTIFEYNSPLVTIKEGRGWIIDGHLKLVHIIRLNDLEESLRKIENTVDIEITLPDKKSLAQYHLAQLRERIQSLKGKHLRKQRSINWIGSAWKWLAGNPDAADWDKILKNEEDIIENNNVQYKINERVLKFTKDITERMNWIIDNTRNQVSTSSKVAHEQDIVNDIFIIKEEVNEIIRACQMARSGIVNTNLLDQEEINRVINEVETLPYANVVEALQFGKPSVFTNDSLLLYVLSIPRVSSTEYNLVHARASIIKGRQLDLPYRKLLVNNKETYGILGKCLTMDNITVCEEDVLENLEKDECIPQLLKGGHAQCIMRSSMTSLVESIEDGTIFVTNFNGSVTSKDTSRNVCGTFIIQLSNETVSINNRTFSSWTTSSLQALPPVFAKTTVRGQKIDVEYLRELGEYNIKRLHTLSQRTISSATIDVITLMFLAFVVIYIWYKIHRPVKLPSIKHMEPSADSSA